MNDNVVIVYNGEQVSVPKEVADFLEQDRKREQAQEKQDARHLSKSEFETVLSGSNCVKRPVEDAVLRNLRLENLRGAITELDVQGQNLLSREFKEISVYRVRTAVINLGQLLWAEKLFLLNQPRADGKVLFGSCIVLHEIVTMTYTCVPIGPIPCDEVDSVFTLNSSQHSTVEIRQHLVAVLQTVGFQKGRHLHLPHILRCGPDNLIHLVLTIIIVNIILVRSEYCRLISVTFCTKSL